jgi:ribosomal protein S18 acetylase RimI-like enzyme
VITLAQEADGPQILAITAEAGVFNSEEVATVEKLWAEYLQCGEGPSGYAFRVYREGETVLGYTCHGPHDLTQGAFDLFWIATAQAARRKGVGRALMANVEKEVRQSGGRLIVVETSGTPAYKPTRDFYLSCGYEWEATIHDFYDAGDDLVFFTKHL